MAQIINTYTKSCMDQNLSNLDLKLLTDSANTTLSGILFHVGTILCEK